MQIYTTKNGERIGPFTIYRIKEMLDSKDLSLDHLGWHEGLDQWKPLSEISTLTSALESLAKKPDKKTEGNQNNVQIRVRQNNAELPLPSSQPVAYSSKIETRNIHPVHRFLARIFDFLLLNALVWMVFDHPQIPPIPENAGSLLDYIGKLNDLIPREEQIRIATIQAGALFVWNFIEALLISSFCTTPGKWLFNIRVTRKSGRPLNYTEAIGRSLIIWIIGIGLGIAFLQILAMAFSFFYLLNKGETLWDRTLHSQVHHRPLGPQKIMLAIGAFLILLSLQSLPMS